MTGRGYFGIGVAAAKSPENVGTLWRTAHALGAAWIFTVGHRYPDARQPTDTTRAARHVPLLAHRDGAAFLDSVPAGCTLVGVEYGDDAVRAPRPLPGFHHPERAVYLLGAEDRGIPRDLQRACAALVYVPAEYCLNVAVAGSIVLYDRTAKAAGENFAMVVGPRP